MRNDAGSACKVRARLPPFDRRAPPGVEVFQVLSVCRGMGRIDCLEPFGQGGSNASDAARVKVYVRITGSVHVALRTIDGIGNLQAFDELGGKEDALGIALYERVTGAPLKNGEPADFEFRTGAYDHIRGSRPGDQRRASLDIMGVLHSGRGGIHIDVFTAEFLHEAFPFGFAGKDGEFRLCGARRGQGCNQ